MRFACANESITGAIQAVFDEFAKSGYHLIGVESMLPAHMHDRDLTPYEKELLEATKDYPVQFKDVHLHKGNS